jgi:hypothetical protein
MLLRCRTENGYILERLVAALTFEVLDVADDALAVDDSAEHNVLLVQMGSGDGRDEELRAIGPWSCVRHAQQKRLAMQLLKVLVFEFLAVDALAARAIALCEVTIIAVSHVLSISSCHSSSPSLDHEALNDAVEAGALVVKWLASLASALLAGT